jgi:hypothetical protein
MARDPEKKSEDEDLDERQDETEQEEAEQLVDPDHPRCPRCGWRNTRLSHTKSMLDSVLRTFSLRAFRCRSCGKRFRAIRRAPRV